MAGPCASIKIAGAYLDTVTVLAFEAAWLAIERTTSAYRPAARVGGSWALICPAELANSGSGVLLNVTHVPPRTVGRGVPAPVGDGAPESDARSFPKIETRPPGATAGK